MSLNPQNMIEQLKDSTKDLRENPTELAQDTGKAIGDTFKEAGSGLKKSIDEFSQKGVMDAGKEFLETNGLLAKFVFIIFVLIAFMVLLNIGMQIIGFFTKQSANPMIVKGKMDGDNSVVISQNPANEDGKTIFRSNNKQTGAEYTWSTWLYMKGEADSSTTRSHVFSKGQGKQVNPAGGSAETEDYYKISNGPGVYAYTSGGETHLDILFDTVGGREQVTVEGIPHNKWFHLALRLQNKIVDVYINGVVAKREELDHLPKQNFHDVTVGGGNGGSGFNGSISNLQYFSYAMNVFEINNIVMRGPNLSTSDLSSDASNKTGNSSFLSNLWYNNTK